MATMMIALRGWGVQGQMSHGCVENSGNRIAHSRFPGCIDILGMFSFFVGHKTPSAG
jgi:hypothetical protein